MARSFSFNPFTSNFDIISEVSLAAVGSSPNSNGASISAAQVLTLQPANTSFPGVLTAADWNTFNNKQPAGNYITALTGDVTASGPGSVPATLATVNGNVGSFGSAAQVGTFTVNAKGLITAASNVSIALSPGSISLTNAHILVGNGSNVAADVAVSGDLTVTNTGAFTVANNVVTNAKLAQMAAHTYKGNNTGATANAIDVTSTQLTADLNLFSSTLQGLVPASGGGTINFLRADGTFAAPPDTGITQLTGDVTAGPGSGSQAATIANNAVSNAKFRQSAAQSVVGNSTNATANVADISASAADQILRANGAGTAISFGSIDLSKSGAVGASILGVANGGTGAATLTANNVILGNGTSAVQFVAPGTSGNVLTSNGTTWTSAAPTGTSIVPTTQIFTSSGTYTKPTSPAPLYVRITVVGSGGGAGDGGNVSGGGGGGGAGAGGTSIRNVIGTSIGSTETVTVGAGGSSSGGNGNTSSFGTWASATGGSGGAAGSSTNGGGGAIGGVGSSGNINTNGGDGNPGDNGIAGTVNGNGGTGGSSTLGGGGRGRVSGTNGSTGGNYGGGGGGGGGNPITPGTGGAGGPGIVIVEEFYQ